MPNLYPTLFDYNNDELYYDKTVRIKRKSKDSILIIKGIELDKAIIDIIMSLSGDYLELQIKLSHTQKNLLLFDCFIIS